MSVKKIVTRELPPVGTELHGKFKGTPYNATIVQDDKMRSKKAIRFNGKNYASMTYAAMAITKQAVNGWRFWKYNLS
jgi:hypothetical protein